MSIIRHPKQHRHFMALLLPFVLNGCATVHNHSDIPLEISPTLRSLPNTQNPLVGGAWQIDHLCHIPLSSAKPSFTLHPVTTNPQQFNLQGLAYAGKLTGTVTLVTPTSTFNITSQIQSADPSLLAKEADLLSCFDHVTQYHISDNHRQLWLIDASNTPLIYATR